MRQTFRPFSIGRAESVLFCKIKEPKNFCQWALCFTTLCNAPDKQSLFASFSSEKEDPPATQPLAMTIIHRGDWAGTASAPYAGASRRRLGAAVPHDCPDPCLP
jgi:hypothetical protein